MNISLPFIRLRPREEKRVKQGSPWAFSNEIVMDATTKALAPGSVVTLVAADETAIGNGYFNPKSLVAVRLLSPPDVAIDKDFFVEKFRRALNLRERLFMAPFYRLVHAEGDRLPGLVIDRFGDDCVVQVTTAGMEQLTETMLAALDEVIAPRSVTLRNDTSSRALEGLDSYVRAARGAPPARLTIVENGARYFADPSAGQKSGWYYDQRDNRLFMAGLAKGASVLDAYCYSGGFGIVAAVQGASAVTFLDSSEGALHLASEAAAANGVDAKCRFKKADVFEELERMAQRGETYTIVVCDPPPFVPSRKDIEAGARAYRKLARLASSVVAPGGFLFLASCSHNMAAERFATECAAGIARNNRRAALIRASGAGPDHPVHPMLSETAYLKALVYALD